MIKNFIINIHIDNINIYQTKQINIGKLELLCKIK